MRILKRWLQIERPAGVALNPSRVVQVAAPYDAVFDDLLHGIEFALGGAVSLADRTRGIVEAVFGLVNSERMSCTLEAEGATTRVRIIMRRGAGVQPRARSQYADALAAYLGRSRDR